MGQFSAAVRSSLRGSHVELGRIRVFDSNLAQCLRTLIVSKPKFEDVASGSELHIAVGIEAKSCKESAGVELRFWPIQWRSQGPVPRSALKL